MNYELAKKLKEAGFPLKQDTYEAFAHVEGFRYVLPTLEELIEACGEEIGGIVRSKEGNLWSTLDRAGDYALPFSDTPKEAVANLWLKLNKKTNGY